MPPFVVDVLAGRAMALTKPSAAVPSRGSRSPDDDRAGPAADAGQDRDVLPAVRPAIGDRLADDPGAGLELPQQLAGPGVDAP